MNIYKNTVSVIIFVLLLNKIVFAIPHSIEITFKKDFKFRKIEITDSSICVVLDSIIAYEEYCMKGKSRLITYYDIWPEFNYSSEGCLKLMAFSRLDNFDFLADSLNDAGVLSYRNRYFIFRDFSKTEGLERYLKVSTFFESVNIKNKKITNLGKTYSTFDIVISTDSIFIDGCYCMCYYGKMGRFSSNVGIRKFFYDVFCSWRGVRRL